MYRLLHTIILILMAGIGAGCASVSYYMNAINGHADIVNHQRPIKEVIADSNTPENVRAALLDFQQARQFAIDELLLPDNDSYQYYTDIHRDFAVWNVVAAQRLSVEPRQWCFLFAGCFNYRGYYSKQQARDYAAELKQTGYDTYVAGSRAYSTLGWFDDPLLSSMLLQNEANRIGILFHELAHQKIYIENDPAFNESFAVFIEQEGVMRWLAYKHKDVALKQYRLTLQRRNQFHSMLLKTRRELSEVYESPVSDSIKLESKAELFHQLRSRYQQLKQQWGGYAGYDKWMQQPLNNAHLALVATYREQVQRFEILLDSYNGDLALFYGAVEELARLPMQDREQRWKKLLRR